MIYPCSIETSPLLSVGGALAKIEADIQPVTATERVVLKSALGRVLAEDIVSPINIPYDRNSAMDGYAISSRDINTNQPFTLSLVGTSWAGKPYRESLTSGQCVRIFTGAVVPNDADSVIIQEQVHSDGEIVAFPANVQAYRNIREAGEDVEQGSLLCRRQKKLTPTDIGLLAAAGIYDVPVRRKLNIAFFSTGDELIGIGQQPEPGKIYDSNRYALAGLLTDPCYNAVDMGTIPDDRALLEDAFKQAAEYNDVIITTGGASVGDADYVKDILASCGKINFWKIAIKPGKPLAFGKIGACYFFGLPGNPVAVVVTFQQIVAKALRQLSGAAESKAMRLLATCTTSLKKAPGRQEFQRGILTQDENGNFFVASTGQQGSHILSSMSQGNCYIILSAECVGVSSGEKVLVEPFGTFL
ncbi:MAG: gephyrin-like molybdotransferase Glp [Methyloglobulus sp.]